MKRVNFFALLLLPGLLFLFISCSSDETVTLQSPEGKNAVVFILKDGKPLYKVTHGGRTVVDTSGLGFELKDMLSLEGNFKLEKAVMSGIRERWEPLWGQRNKIRDHYNHLLVTLKEKSDPGRTMELEFRAYEDGIGFRYIVPEQDGLGKIEITREITEFLFTEDPVTWWIPGDYDNHEFLYRDTPLSQIDSANTPLTMEASDSLYLSIHEAALINYPEMRLKRDNVEPLKLNCDLVPWPDGVKAKLEVPFRTPWRTIQLAGEPGELFESALILNFNEPDSLEDDSWIRPMKYIGIWWGIGKSTWAAGPKHGATTENAKADIDFAAENGIPGMLVEGWNKGWEEWADSDGFKMTGAYDDYNLEEVAAYAQKKGIYLMVHNETGGNAEWYEKEVDEAFARYEQLGIHAIKTGYVGKLRPQGQYHHGQWMVNHQALIVEKAAKHKIMVDAHETVKATGLERTWPNLMSCEWGRGYKPDNRDNSTVAKQLALMVVIYSPFQIVADLPENYKDHPAFRFIKDVPVDWDDTEVLNGKIGDYVTIARKKKDAWYIGSITDENPREFEFKLDFLDEKTNYEAVIYADGPTADWISNPEDYVIEKKLVRKDDEFKMALAAGGGQAIVIKPIE